MAEDMCVVCRRREPVTGSVCTPDLWTLQAMLDDLPRKLRVLPLMLVPGQSPGGERTATTRVGSPTPARLDALSLVGPGSTPLPGALHPLIRRRHTQREVRVTARVGAYRVVEHVFVLTEWHQEIAVDDDGKPVMVPDDDQAGILPPAEWLDQTVRRWRTAFGHQRPAPRELFAGGRAKTPEATAMAVSWLATLPPEQVAVMATARKLWMCGQQGLTDLTVGNEPGYGGNRPDRLREDDPVADAWRIRFGQSGGVPVSANIAYLRAWLGRAAERDRIDLGAFTAELRSLTAELTRVLGELPDQQWLGKCPALIADQTAGTSDHCGAGLWQDPHASVVECPRCHSSWGPRMVHLTHLAAEIRRVWPLDRRRRYHADEIDALREVRCPDCAEPVNVMWQEVTAVGDKRRWWRPASTKCPHGCPRGAGIL